jgi:hypothetical protein
MRNHFTKKIEILTLDAITKNIRLNTFGTYEYYVIKQEIHNKCFAEGQVARYIDFNLIEELIEWPTNSHTHTGTKMQK